LVHSIVEKLKSDKAHQVRAVCNLVDSLLNLRLQRPGLVQTKEQFIFCYFAILDAANELGLQLQSSVAPEEEPQ